MNRASALSGAAAGPSGTRAAAASSQAISARRRASETPTSEGSVAFPPYGLPIPFATARGSLTLAPATGLAIESLELEDPDRLSLRASGTIGASPSPELSPLDLTARVEVRDPALRSLFAQALPLDGEGNADLRLSGTLGAPILR